MQFTVCGGKFFLVTIIIEKRMPLAELLTAFFKSVTNKANCPPATAN
jgi:hypothetical protein